MRIDFSDKTVIVTGGARGIGAAISIQFAHAGARVMIDYLPIEKDIEGLRGVEEQILAAGGTYGTFAGDVSSPQEMEELCRKTAQRFGSIDVLVNCAGFTKSGKMTEVTVDIWKKGIEVNLSGAFYVTYFVSKYMVAQKRGRIIYIGSAGSITGGGGAVFYPSAKAGIMGLVRSLSKELAPLGITVNAVLPALIDTDLLRDREPDPERRKEYVKRVPVGRLGQPEDVAYAVLFLASDYAGFITGQNIIVDGGATFK